MQLTPLLDGLHAGGDSSAGVGPSVLQQGTSGNITVKSIDEWRVHLWATITRASAPQQALEGMGTETPSA